MDLILWKYLLSVSNQETKIQQEIRLALGRIKNLRLFRNETGQLPDPRTDRWVQFGLAKGSSDLIGFKTIKITQDMVGSSVAQFVSIEVKTPTGKPTQIQQNWLHCIKSAGGISGIARSIEDAKKILDL